MALHTPQHILKGTSKLDNCLYDQCVLKIYELHDSYLVEAINTRIYILKIVHQPLKRWLNGGPRHNKVRKRLPCIRRHLIVHSKTFDSVFYVHMPCKHRTKLDAKSNVYMFIEYSPKAQPYGLYDVTWKKILNWGTRFYKCAYIYLG